ncbi:hypothetical protein ES703_70341 [subsurface metagenome]
MDFVDVVDTTFERLTGKNIATWLKEFQQPKELPSGQPVAPQQQPAMPLADAYAVLGLPPTASLKDVKRNYKRLAAIFHPDAGGYDEAMKLLNRAYERIDWEKEGGNA